MSVTGTAATKVSDIHTTSNMILGSAAVAAPPSSSTMLAGLASAELTPPTTMNTTMYTDINEADMTPEMTLRSLVSTKEAGIVIGKGGASVAHVRQIASVKVGVSKVVSSVSERILTVVGPLPNVSKAYALIANNLLEGAQTAAGPSSPTMDPSGESTAIRLLVAHQLIGSIIGKAGAKIREIQEASGAKIVVSKEMLPQSTERVVEIYGLVDAIHIAIYHIGMCIKSDTERAAGIIYYDPQNSLRYGSSPFSSAAPSNQPRSSLRNGQSGGVSGERVHRETRDPASISTGRRHSNNNYNAPATTSRILAMPSAGPSGGVLIGTPFGAITDPVETSETHTRVMTVQADMVPSCTLGSKSMAVTDRDVTIVGTDDANRKAVSLLYNQLEAEKDRRLSQAAQVEEDRGNVQR
ncbi:hypothetical protein BASA61_003113 [Batrachochytrium salamandrivorans]|nr:hypothetical protein BASA61_003113 [Batrachochytrium salamandrivorans]